MKFTAKARSSRRKEVHATSSLYFATFSASGRGSDPFLRTQPLLETLSETIVQGRSLQKCVRPRPVNGFSVSSVYNFLFYLIIYSSFAFTQQSTNSKSLCFAHVPAFSPGQTRVRVGGRIRDRRFGDSRQSTVPSPTRLVHDG